MGRSKPSRSPAVKTPSALKTPEKPTQKVTPGKSGTKRPLPQDSDNEEEVKELVLANGDLQPKKGKFMADSSEEDIHASDSEGSENDSEEDENETEGDEDDSEEDENDSEGDEDDSDVDEDEETEESDENPVESENVPSKATLVNTKKSQEAPEKAIHLLIPNPPHELELLKKNMIEKGYPAESVNLLTVRFGHVTLPLGTQVKGLVTGESSFSLNGKTVNFLQLSGSDEALKSIDPEGNDTLFLAGIPKSVTMEMIVAKLPKACKTTTRKLLTEGPRNQRFNAAFISFASKTEAATALSALRNAMFGDRKVHVTYARPQQGKSDSPSEFSIRITNVPKGVKFSEVLSLFPGGVEDRREQNDFFVRFPDSATLRTAVNGEKVLQNQVLGIAVYGGLKGNVRLLKSISFNASETDIREAYPEATKITMNKRPDGAFNGSAFVEFSSTEAANSAVAQNISINGRRIIAQSCYVNLPSQKKKPVALKATKPPKKAPLPQVGSASEDEDEESEESSDVEMAAPTKMNVKKVKNDEDSDDENDDESGDEDEEEDDEDDDDEDDEDEDDDESGGSEDEGIDGSDDEMPAAKIPKKGNFPNKHQANKFDNQNRGNRGGGRGFSPRGRGFGRGRGGGGFHRGGQDGGFKPRGGGGRGRGRFQRGRGGFRGHKD